MFRPIVKREVHKALVAGDDGAILQLTVDDLRVIVHALLGCNQVEPEERREFCFDPSMNLIELINPIIDDANKRIDAAH